MSILVDDCFDFQVSLKILDSACLRYLNGKQELSSGTSIILVIHISKQNLKGENKIEEAKSEEPLLTQ